MLFGVKVLGDFPLCRHFNKQWAKIDHIPCTSLSERELDAFDYFSFIKEENDDGSFIRNVPKTWLSNANYIFGNE